MADSSTATCPALWAGTNSGLVLVFSIAIPERMEQRFSEGVQAELAKDPVKYFVNFFEQNQ